MTPKNRRHFLRTAGAAVAATAYSMNANAAFPEAIRRALAIPANNKTGTIRDVEHVVILMQENRSFDHYFGTLHGVRGFADRFPIPLAGNRNVMQQTYINSSKQSRVILPYHLDSRIGNAQRVNGTPHTYDNAQEAWDLGRMNSWPTYKQTQSMGYYTAVELDFQFALANAFTVCDAYHCSFHGGTNTNRLYHWTGTNNPAGDKGGPAIDNSQDHLEVSTSPTSYSWKTYPERLQKQGVSWKVYQNMPDNFTDNPLAGFVAYRQSNELRGNVAGGDNGGAPYPAWQPSDDAGNPLFKGVGNTMPDGGFLAALKEDIGAGALPQVSWIVAPATYSEHPGPSSPVQGAWYVQEVLNALTANPAVWSKTVLLINFDENDGFFDHVPPPCAPGYQDGELAGYSSISTDGEYFSSKASAAYEKHPYGPGPRVPMYVVSPWSRGGWVNSQVFDHTSVLRFLEARFHVKEENISPYRKAVCGDLLSAFNFAHPNDEVLPTLPKRSRAEADAVRAQQEKLKQVALPSEGSQVWPMQSAGIRPSRALPYELHVHARTHVRRNDIVLTFRNTGRAAAVFHVYDRLHLDRVPRRYALEAGKEWQDSWDLNADRGAYDLWVLGPNGFHRAFQGNLSTLDADDGAVPEVKLSYDVFSKRICLTMMNRGEKSCVVTVKLNAYRKAGPWTFHVPAGMQLDQHWPVGSQGNWYDFTATVPVGGFTRRFAGRMETGAHSVSDPAMALTS
ncbi:phosphocholine-specific phospholipase C [Collimonas humicola]|uniref:phosphocholine-specific phospholipase C n=1 Tax=Collimonas humicola TaxID=2825886 RepID=UPI001B8D447C|nr:phospholipase C, phosphocholine-specific [Collimonas humicola]